MLGTEVLDLLPERYKYSFLKNIIWLTESPGKEIILCRNDSLRMIISLALIRTISSCADWDSLYTAATCRFHLLLFRISHPYNRLSLLSGFTVVIYHGMKGIAAFLYASSRAFNTFAAKHLKNQYLSAKHVSRTPEY